MQNLHILLNRLKATPLLIFLTQIQLCTVFEGISICTGSSSVFAHDLRPLDSDGRVIPCQAAFVIGMVKVVALIAELSSITEHQEAMGKTAGNQELLLVLFRQLNAVPLSKGCAVFAQVNRHIKHAAFDDPDQFGLGEVLLEV